MMLYSGLILFCLLLPFQFALNPAQGIDLAIVRIIVPAMFLIWLFLLLKKKVDPAIICNKTTCLLGIFIFLAICSLAFSHNFAWSLRKLAFLLSLVPVYFIALSVLGTKYRQRGIIISLVGGATLIAIFGIIQFSAQFVFGIDSVYSFLAQNITPFFLGNSFSKAVLAYPSWLVNSEGVTYMRAFANFPDPHMFSYYLGLLIPWSVAMWATTKSHKKLFFISSFLLILGDILTFTRGSYVALIASALVVLPLVSKNTAKKLLLGIILFIFLLNIVPHNPITGRFVSSFDTKEGSNRARISNWQQSLEIIKNHPLGVGIGMYSLAVKPEAAYREPIYAHNLYLDIAAELGLPAVLVFGLLLFLAGKNFWQTTKRQPFFAAGVASLTVFVVHSLVESPLYSVHILPLILIIIALSASLHPHEKITDNLPPHLKLKSKILNYFLKKHKKSNLIVYSQKIIGVGVNSLFLLAIFCMPFYLIRVNIFGLPSNIFEILALLAATLLFLKERKKVFEKIFGLPKLLLISTVIILAGVLLSILFNNNYRAGFGIFKSWFLLPILFSFLLYTVLNSKADIEKVFLSIYLSVATVSCIGIVYKLLGIVTYDGRLEAFYSSPNYLAIYLSSGVFFGFYFLAKSYFEKAYSKKFFAHLFLILLILFALYFSYSYGAWLAVFLALFFAIFLNISRKKLLLTGLFFIIAIVIFIFQLNAPKFSDLVNFSERSSFASRTMIWDASFLMIKQNPVWGIGPGNFQESYLALQKYFPPYLEWAVPQPHNVFLAFWLQTGLVGLAGFLLLLFFVCKIIFETIKNKKDALLVAPLLGFFLYTILHGLVDTTYWKNDFSFLFWLCVFLAICFNKSFKK